MLLLFLKPTSNCTGTGVAAATTLSFTSDTKVTVKVTEPVPLPKVFAGWETLSIWNELVELVYEESIRHPDVREIGSEWLCYQALEQLKLADFLVNTGFSERRNAACINPNHRPRGLSRIRAGRIYKILRHF
jgi:hypothetical protein